MTFEEIISQLPKPYYSDSEVAIYHADCRELLPLISDKSVDLVLTDPPYGIGFMGKDWDKALPDKQIWVECLRVLKDGAFAFVMSIPRADCLSRMIISLEDVGFMVNFTPIFWAYASGFPKATNISKMVDKRGGTYTDCQQFSRYLKARREASGISLKQMNKMFGYVASCSWWESLNPNNFRFPNNEDYQKLKELLQLDDNFDYLQGIIGDKVGEKIRGNAGFSKEQVPRPWKEHIGEEYNITAPATPQAKALDGSYGGFQPKPAIEVIIVAMKPLSEKTFVDQALKNQKGITWLDEGRIPFEQGGDVASNPKLRVERGCKTETGDRVFCQGKLGKKNTMVENALTGGRFPANLCVSDDVLNDGKIVPRAGNKQNPLINGGFLGSYGKHSYDISKSDEGSFSRFFDLDKWFEERIKLLPKSVQKTFPFLIVPKASKSEKNRGCEDMESKVGGSMIANIGDVMSLGGASLKGEHKQIQSSKNFHPTVKPLKLMSYLITLGSREGDVILDPFGGSGTTAVASQLMSRRSIICEIDEDYCEISAKRCSQSVMRLEV